MVSLGILLVVLGALGAWRYVGVAASATKAYLAVYTEVQAGTQLTADMLQTVHITPANGLTPIPAGDIDTVLGTYARVTLYPGSLLTTDQLTTTQGPSADQAVLGIYLGSDQRPGSGVHAGSSVMLVGLPDSNAAANADPAALAGLPTWPATVVSVESALSNGNQVINVVVTKAVYAEIAALADQSRIALVLVAGG